MCCYKGAFILSCVQCFAVLNSGYTSMLACAQGFLCVCACFHPIHYVLENFSSRLSVPFRQPFDCHARSANQRAVLCGGGSTHGGRCLYMYAPVLCIYACACACARLCKGIPDLVAVTLIQTPTKPRSNPNPYPKP